MRPPYHQTTPLSSEVLKAATATARTQEDKVRAYFRTFPYGHRASASRVHQAIFGWNSPVPLTSTRRAITNLTVAGILVMTDRTIPGAFGKPEHLYQMAAPPGQLPLL